MAEVIFVGQKYFRNRLSDLYSFQPCSKYLKLRGRCVKIVLFVYYNEMYFPSAAVKFGRMSKKQRDSLYAEVQKHQKSQECVGSGGSALSLPKEDGICGGGGEDVEEGLSRSYSSGGSSSTLSDLDDIATLPDLFDLPLTPEEASEYCSLELLGGGASTGNTSSSSSSSSFSSSLSNQNSPQQTILDGADSNGIQLLHTHSHTHPLLRHTHALLDHLPDDCSITDLGEF